MNQIHISCILSWLWLYNLLRVSDAFPFKLVTANFNYGRSPIVRS
jgi:hypothetical protein